MKKKTSGWVLHIASMLLVASIGAMTDASAQDVCADAPNPPPYDLDLYMNPTYDSGFCEGKKGFKFTFTSDKVEQSFYNPEIKFVCTGGFTGHITEILQVVECPPGEGFVATFTSDYDHSQDPPLIEGVLRLVRVGNSHTKSDTSWIPWITGAGGCVVGAVVGTGLTICGVALCKMVKRKRSTYTKVINENDDN